MLPQNAKSRGGLDFMEEDTFLEIEDLSMTFVTSLIYVLFNYFY